MNPHILRLRSMREQTEAVGETMKYEAERFTALANRDAVRVVSAFNLFQTPVAIADRMARLADPQDGERWLEPSAGLGRLYQAIRNRSQAHVTLVENAPQCASELYRQTEQDDCAQLIQEDFLECTVDRIGLFHGVLMNPPFKMGRDIKHIRNAERFVLPGGKIVSLCYAGPKQRAAFENRNGWTWELLPSGSFKTEGTGADVALIWKQV